MRAQHLYKMLDSRSWMYYYYYYYFCFINHNSYIYIERETLIYIHPYIHVYGPPYIRILSILIDIFIYIIYIYTSASSLLPVIIAGTRFACHEFITNAGKSWYLWSFNWHLLLLSNAPVFCLQLDYFSCWFLCVLFLYIFICMYLCIRVLERKKLH